MNVATVGGNPFHSYVEVKGKVNFISKSEMFVRLLVVKPTEYYINISVIVGTNIIKYYPLCSSEEESSHVPDKLSFVVDS